MPHNNWQHCYKRYNMICGPSRLVWFAVGSVATWAWIRHHHGGHGACPPRVGYGYHPHHHAGRAQWEQHDQSAPPSPNNASSSSSPGHGGDYGQWRPTQPQPPTQTQTQTQGQFESITPMDRERLRQISRSAEDTISGMSETTIDGMMGGLQRLKDLLAERRGQQQLQEVGPQQVNPTMATSPEEPTGPRHYV